MCIRDRSTLRIRYLRYSDDLTMILRKYFVIRVYTFTQSLTSLDCRRSYLQRTSFNIATKTGSFIERLSQYVKHFIEFFARMRRRGGGVVLFVRYNLENTAATYDEYCERCWPVYCLPCPSCTSSPDVNIFLEQFSMSARINDASRTLS